jgi:transposase
MTALTIGLDLAKHVFQVHGIDASGKVVLRKKLRRSEMIEFFQKLPPSLIGVEACGTSHHWSRVLTGLGHEVKQMPASYVKPYIKRNKNDAVDAEAVREAVTRPTMRFVEIKTVDQQSGLMLHRTRELLTKQRTMLINSLRGQLAEFGLIAPKGTWSIPDLHELARDASEAVLPVAVRGCVELIVGQIDDLQARVDALEKAIIANHRASEISQRLQSIPGIGVITASAITATIADASMFKSGRHFAAWIGLVPSQSGTGGKVFLSRITKKGDPYLRKLLVLGATAVIRYSRNKPGLADWINAPLARRSARVVTIAVANKLARIAWAVTSRGERFNQALSTVA